MLEQCANRHSYSVDQVPISTLEVLIGTSEVPIDTPNFGLVLHIFDVFSGLFKSYFFYPFFIVKPFPSWLQTLENLKPYLNMIRDSKPYPSIKWRNLKVN